MNVLLISPPSRVMNHYRPPLALMYLSGFLKRNSINAKVIDVVLKEQIRDRNFYQNKNEYLRQVEEDIVNRVRAEETDIIGITCYTPEIAEVESLARQIKNVKPHVKIVVGGIHPTLYPKDFFTQMSPFDFVVIGEGEVVFLELVRAIRAQTDLSDVRGIGYYDSTKARIVLTQAQPLVQNLDDISYPDTDDLDMDYYTTASPYAIRGVFTRSFYISSSRGCPSSCTFCVSKKLRETHGVERFVRLRSAQSLYKEISELRQKYGIDAFYFIDDLFTLNKNNVVAFCELLNKNKMPLIWGCSSKVNTVNFEMLKIMRDAGCVQIDFGVEKGSDPALARIKKGITIDQIRSTFSACHKLGIRTFANMLVNTPGETEGDLDDMIRLVEAIKPEIVSFNVFTPYPGCEIYDSFCATSIGLKDFPSLMEDPNGLIERNPAVFRFAKHGKDLRQWGASAMKKYNKILPNLAIFLNNRYMKSLLLSRKKLDYLRSFSGLMRELVLQKFS